MTVAHAYKTGALCKKKLFTSLSKMKEYFITKPNGQQEGPYGAEALRSRVDAGKYEEGTTVWTEGLPGWEPLFKHFPMQVSQGEQDTPSSQSEAESQLPTVDELIAMLNEQSSDVSLPSASKPISKTQTAPVTASRRIKAKPTAPFASQDASEQKNGLRRSLPLSQFLIYQVIILGLLIAAYFIFRDSGSGEAKSELAEETIVEKVEATSLPSESKTAAENTSPAVPTPAPTPVPAPTATPVPTATPTSTATPSSTATPAQTPAKKTTTKTALGSVLNYFSGNSDEKEGSLTEEDDDEQEITSESASYDEVDEVDEVGEVAGEDENTEELKELSDSDKKKLRSLQRGIKSMYKRKSNCYKNIALFKHKIMLHETCRSCGLSHCNSQGVTGACRHWYMAPFDKKNIRVSHQLPRGNNRYSGIDQAISSLNIKIEQQERTIDRVNEKINEIADDISELTGRSSNVPDEPEYEYEDYRPSRYRSYSDYSSSGSSSSYRRYER